MRSETRRAFDRFTSIRAKLATAIIVAVGLTVLLIYVVLAFTLPRSIVVDGRLHQGIWHDTLEFVQHAWWLLLLAAALSAGVALVFVRLLARGMTKPLRDMAQAVEKMTRGDYSERVHASSHDEVGRLAGAFNRMAADLERVERLRRDLVANVSHELKTPIAAIRAHLENLLEGVEQPSARTLEVMLRQSERLSLLVEQVLDLSRLESGSSPIDQEPVSLAPVVDQVIAELAIARRDHAVVVQNRIPPSLRPAKADRQRLHQVLYNLLDNAVRFTPPGGEVTVGAAETGPMIVVRVEDSGPGIPDEAIPFVFERFYRADAARSRADGGAGLGLAIARSIVDAHGGTIVAEKRASLGMRFSFTLPTDDSEPSTPQQGMRSGTNAKSASATAIKEDV